jgi:cytochrome c2
VVWTDPRFIFELAPVAERGGTAPAPDVIGTCGACHGFTPEATTAIGPNLWGVYGRMIGASDYAGYSEALRKTEGVWSEEKLRAFVLDPQSVIPGTSMPTPPPPDEETLTALIATLRSLQ